MKSQTALPNTWFRQWILTFLRDHGVFNFWFYQISLLFILFNKFVLRPYAKSRNNVTYYTDEKSSTITLDTVYIHYLLWILMRQKHMSREKVRVLLQRNKVSWKKLSQFLEFQQNLKKFAPTAHLLSINC